MEPGTLDRPQAADRGRPLLSQHHGRVPPYKQQLKSQGSDIAGLLRDDATSSSALSLFDYAGSLVSTVGSWDDSEQDYDAKATREVQDMLENLEGFLYRENQASVENGALLDECKQWSVLFPHIRSTTRIRGRQLLQLKESGFELIARGDARCHSPYLLVPEQALDAGAMTLEIHGIGLTGDTVARHDSLPREELLGSFLASGVDSMIDWSDHEVHKALGRLRDERDDPSFWWAS
nr:hypothetical protein HK105_001291 [Polyrhizophydium stewartii]